MVTITSWAHPVNGDFNTATNWTNGAPAAGVQTLITAPGTYTVTSNAINSVANLEMEKKATLAINSNSLSITNGEALLAGTIVVADGAELGLGIDGAIRTMNNTGVIDLQSTGNPTSLTISGNVTLTGKGKINLSSNAEIESDGSAATLTNAGNTISGFGDIGDNFLSFDNASKSVVNGNSGIDIISAVNNAGILKSTAIAGYFYFTSDVTNTSKGVIKATGGGVVEPAGGVTITGGTISTAAGAEMIFSGGSGALATISGSKVINAGTMAVTGEDLSISGAVKNTGTLRADDHTLSIGGAVKGGEAEIGGTGEIGFQGASSAKVTFDPGSTGVLILGQTAQFTVQLPACRPIPMHISC